MQQLNYKKSVWCFFLIKALNIPLMKAFKLLLQGSEGILNLNAVLCF